MYFTSSDMVNSYKLKEKVMRRLKVDEAKTINWDFLHV